MFVVVEIGWMKLWDIECGIGEVVMGGKCIMLIGVVMCLIIDMFWELF